jgi:hypothetical protein
LLSAVTNYVYPTSAMIGDYFRAAAGLVPAAAILVTLPVESVATIVLGGFAALFAGFGIRTIVRHQTRLEVTGPALRATGFRRASIVWEQLDRMNLTYYSTRRDRREGWMQLDLRSGRSRIRLDSRITGFAELVEIAARAAEARGLTLNAATAANLAALGVRSGAERPIREAVGDPV